MFASRRRIGRWLKRSLVAAGLVAFLGVAWFLLLPVPFTWAVRLALRITLPPGRDQARVRLDRAVFRFGLLEPSVRINLYGIAVEGASGGQLARNIEHVEVRFQKRALWHRNWAPSLIEVSRPVLIVDLTKSGGPTTPASAPGATSESPSASLAVRTAALRAFIPLPDSPCRFFVQEPSLDIRTPGREVHWLFQNIDTAFSREGDRLRFEFPIALANTRHPVRLTCRIDGSLQTGRVGFTVSLSRFSSEDLPPLPLLPGESEKCKFRIAFDLAGILRLDQLRLEEVNLAFLADEGEFHLPAFKSSAIRIGRLEIRGRARDDFHFIHLDTAILALDSLRIDASGLEAETGPSPRLNAHVVVAGPVAADIGAYLPAEVLARLPFPTEALREIRLRSSAIDVVGSAQLGRDGRLAAQTLAFDGHVNLDLNGENVALVVTAAIDGAGQPIRAHFSAPEINPARLHLAALKPYSVLSALDCPVKLDVEATATARGELRTASLNLAIGPGRLRAFGPVARDLSLKSAAVRLDASDGGRTIRISELRLELEGSVLSAMELTAKLMPAGLVAVQGKVLAENVSGEFLERIGQDTAFAPLVALGLTPENLRIARLAGSFSARVAPLAHDIWPTIAATLDESTDLVVQGEPLNLQLSGKIDGAMDSIDVTMKTADFWPARFRLTLPSGLSSTALDFPARLQARAVGGLKTQMRLVDGSLAVGPGILHANPYFDGELPITSLSFDTSFDYRLHCAEISVRADLGGLVARADRLKLTNGPKPIVSGRLELEGATIARILRVWPASLHSALRRQVADLIKAGGVAKADLRFIVPVDLEQPAATRPTEMSGNVLFDELRLESPYCPGPLKLVKLAIAVKYPGGVATLTNLSGPGVTLAKINLRTPDCFAPAVDIAIDSDFAADLSKTSAWLQTLGIGLPKGLPLNPAELAGTASGNLHATFPLAESFDSRLLNARFQAQIDGPVVPITTAGTQLGGGLFALSLDVHRGEFSAAIDWKDLDLTLPGLRSNRLALHLDATLPRVDELDLHATLDARRASQFLNGVSVPPLAAPLKVDAHLAGWGTQRDISAQMSASSSDFLGGPLAIAAHATLSNLSGRLESASVAPLQLGRTNLSVEFTNPAAGHYVLTVKGGRLDASGLLRLAGPFVAGSPVAADRRTAAAILSPGRKETGRGTAAAPAGSGGRTDAPPQFANLQASVAIDSVDFYGGRDVRALNLSTSIVDDFPQVLSFSGQENGTNALTLLLKPKGDHQSIRLTIADASAWVQLVAQTLRDLPLPNNAMAELAGALGQIPVLLSGGEFDLSGDVRLRDDARWFDGQCKLTDIEIRHPPRILQLIALKSGKHLLENPGVKEISVGRLFVSPTLVALEGIKADAASLNHLKLNFIRYGLADEALHLDGQYAGVGFEVLGTRAEPQVFLKNNLLIRAIGSEQEFAFAEVPAAAPPPPPKKE
jgi:hypothetical protein